MDKVINNPLVQIICWLIALILPIVYYRKGKRVRKIYYCKKNNAIIKEFKSNIELLDIKYKGNDIPNLSATKLLIWNAGNETIDNDDITRTNPLTFSITGNKLILDYNFIYTKNKVNELLLEPKIPSKKIEISFNYLDPKEGAIIQIIHTGISAKDIVVEGTIKGSTNIKEIDLNLTGLISDNFYQTLIKYFDKYLFLAPLFYIPMIFYIFVLSDSVITLAPPIITVIVCLFLSGFIAFRKHSKIIPMDYDALFK